MTQVLGCDKVELMRQREGRGKGAQDKPTAVSPTGGAEAEKSEEGGGALRLC